MAMNVDVIDTPVVQDDSGMDTSDSNEASLKQQFPPVSVTEMNGGRAQTRKIIVPSHRYTPLKKHWMEIYDPVVTHMKLQIRFDPKQRNVFLRTSEHTADPGSLQKGCDFVQAFILGFEIKDAIALLRMDDLYVESFEIDDVKMLRGDNLSRAIGRIAGKDGKTKFAIENATRTRIVLADKKIHLLGTYRNNRLARDAICSLILGSPPGKVYNRLRMVSARVNER